MIRAPNPAAIISVPSNVIRGRGLAVCGNFLGAGSALAVSTGGAGASSTNRTASAGGGGGGGGISPVTFLVCSATVVGVSVMTLAETIMPFLSSKTVFSCPSIMNFWSLGTLYTLAVPSSSCKVTVLGAFTIRTLP